MRRLGRAGASLGVLVGAVVAAPAPAWAEWEWVPEGQFWVRYSGPLQGPPRSGPDANFELLTGVFGARLKLLPGISLRAAGELLSLDRSRRLGDLRLGYAEWATDTLGTFRAGQIPTFREAEDYIVGDPILGPGVFTKAGFFSSGGLGGSWSRDFALEPATLSLDVGGTYTEGLLGSGALAPNATFAGYTGTGPSALARASIAWPGGLATHLFGRYGLIVDQQAGAAITGRLFDLDILGSAGASVSTPTGEPAVTDLAGMARVRYNLGNLVTEWWRTDIVLRSAAIARNITGAATASVAVPGAVPRTDLESTLGIVYKIADATMVGVDLTESRNLTSGATPSLFLGVRTGVRF